MVSHWLQLGFDKLESCVMLALLGSISSCEIEFDKSFWGVMLQMFLENRRLKRDPASNQIIRPCAKIYNEFRLLKSPYRNLRNNAP